MSSSAKGYVRATRAAANLYDPPPWKVTLYYCLAILWLISAAFNVGFGVIQGSTPDMGRGLVQALVGVGLLLKSDWVWLIVRILCWLTIISLVVCGWVLAVELPWFWAVLIGQVLLAGLQLWVIEDYD